MKKKAVSKKSVSKKTSIKKEVQSKSEKKDLPMDHIISQLKEDSNSFSVVVDVKELTKNPTKHQNVLEVVKLAQADHDLTAQRVSGVAGRLSIKCKVKTIIIFNE